MRVGKRQVISAVEYYSKRFESRTTEELRSIAHVKRFLELFTMDSGFRQALVAPSGNGQTIVDPRGLDVDLSLLARFRKDEKCLPDEQGGGAGFPLMEMWRKWIRDLRAFRSLAREDGYSDVAGSRFNAWRKRQVERVNSEFGDTKGDAIVHPIFCFELSKGCSMGCWFCAFGAEPLKGVFKRTRENSRLWREILQVAVDLFGIAAQTGFCYGATEPYDNPHYLDFVEDFREIVGVLPQTTSAAPVKDLQWTRRLIEMQRRPPAKPSRFSILSLGALRKLHDAFTPEELLRFELLPQNKESITAKARAGRTLEKADDPESKHRGLRIAGNAGSIACVSGFQVNMVDRSIELISPCAASDRRPLGYRVHVAGTFENAQDFGDFIERAIADHMPTTLPDDRPVAFRPDLTAGPVENGFALRSAFKTHTCSGSPHIRFLGWLIAQGKHTPARILNILTEHGADIFSVRSTLQDLFDKGLLEE
ncbi:radical SAM family RiPP maturation amino acid epimerase [Thermodesulfobacteriota bacterium]